MIEQIYMFFDVESVGLHGDGFSVGYAVFEDGREIESGYYQCNPGIASGNAADRKWIEANVVPASREYIGHTFGDGMGSKSPRDVRERFWEKWACWRGRGAVLVADCPWPVEARFLIACISDDPAGRAFDGPYPFIDVASVRLAAGYDPLATVPRLEDEKPVHHPLADARQSARLFFEAMSVMAGVAKGA